MFFKVITVSLLEPGVQGIKTIKKAVMQMTAVNTVLLHLSECSGGLGTFPNGGCRSVIGPFPRLLLMKDNVLLMVYIVPLREYTVKSFFAFLENFFVSCYNEPTHRRALYPYCIRLDKMSQQPLSGGPASPYICRST